jgi:hypothetical protein
MKRLLVTAAVMCAIPATGFADETLKYRIVQHITSATTQDVGDVDGHTMTLLKAQGVALFPDGTIGQVTVVSNTDYIRGNGNFFANSGVIFSDGSAIWVNGLGRATVKGQTTELTQPLTIIGGKGRYAGAKGDGMATGTRLQPLPNTGAEIIVDVTLNVKK